jgi:hypothetical protein
MSVNSGSAFGVFSNSANVVAEQRDTPDVAIGIAVPHAGKDLTVLKQLEPPVGHGHSVQKERSVPIWKVRIAFNTQRRWRLYADHRLAPLRRSRSGAVTPILRWRRCADHHGRQYADPGMAP